MAEAVSACVHCGFCLAACPTYRVLGEEMDSPRGRIILMKEALEGGLTLQDALPYVDRCLGCLACEGACPSGVRYRELLVPFRAHVDEQGARPLADRLRQRVLLSILESPTRFRAALLAGRLARPLSRLLPASSRDMLRLLPPRPPDASSLPTVVAAQGTRRARVALLAGCVQRVLRPSINTATLRILSANGVEVIVPSAQGCCGALARHTGDQRRAQALTDHNRRVFPADVDAIVTTAAGCGSAMKDDGYDSAVQDVSEFLDALGMRIPLSFAAPTVVAYHDACHLSHGQGIRDAPRRLLGHIAHVTVAELGDGETCCGSAGLYNLEHGDTAAELGRRKAAAIRETRAQLVATGNVGCLAQIATYLDAIPVLHTIEVLDSAYRAGA